MRKPILCLDFDGVMHSYSSGWKGADVVPDPPVPGLFEFLERAAPVFDIQVYSSRSNQPGGIAAMMAWLVGHRRQWREAGGQGSEVLTVSFPESKPPAMVTIDDRALTFTGAWPDPKDLLAFEPWNKKPPAPAVPPAVSHDAWRPIDTAPRDSIGVAVVARMTCCGGGQGTVVMTAARSNGRWVISSDHQFELLRWCPLPPLQDNWETTGRG